MKAVSRERENFGGSCECEDFEGRFFTPNSASITGTGALASHERLRMGQFPKHFRCTHTTRHTRTSGAARRGAPGRGGGPAARPRRGTVCGDSHPTGSSPILKFRPPTNECIVGVISSFAHQGTTFLTIRSHKFR